MSLLWKRFLRLCALSLVVGGPLLLAGCGEVDEYKTAQPDEAEEVVLGSDEAEVEDTPVEISGEDLVPEAAEDLESALGSTSDDLSGAAADITSTAPTSGQDRWEKADIYWKLVYLKDQVANGRMPVDMDLQLEQLRNRADGTADDDAKPLLRQVISDLEATADARGQEDSMRRAGVNPDSVSWGIGRSALEDRFQRLADPAPGARLPTSRRLSDAQRMALDFESLYHASPSTVQREAVARAAQGLQELRGLLDRARREARDHPLSAGSPEQGMPRALPKRLNVLPGLPR